MANLVETAHNDNKYHKQNYKKLRYSYLEAGNGVLMVEEASGVYV